MIRWGLTHDLFAVWYWKLTCSVVFWFFLCVCDHPESPYPLCRKRPPVSLTRCFLHILTLSHSVKMFDASASRAVSGSEIMLCTLFSLRFFYLFYFIFFACTTWPYYSCWCWLTTPRYSGHSLWEAGCVAVCQGLVINQANRYNRNTEWLEDAVFPDTTQCADSEKLLRAAMANKQQ